MVNFAFMALVVGLLVAPPLGTLMLGLGLIISIWITQAIAQKLGGTGTYTKLVYTFAAYLAPLIIVSFLVLSVPFGGSVFYLYGWSNNAVSNLQTISVTLALAVWVCLVIYGTALNVMAVKAINQFGWGKAIVSNLLIFSVTLALALWVFHWWAI